MVVNLNLFECKVGDSALTEFRKFLANEAVTEKQKFIEFKRTEQRLDEFYFLFENSEPVPVIISSSEVSYNV